MKCIHLSIIDGIKLTQIVQYNGMYYIEDNQSTEFNNVTFMTYESAKNVLDNMKEILEHDSKAQV